MLSKRDFENRANRLWQDKCPFLFVVDFDLCNFQIYELAEMPSEILYDFEGRTNVSLSKGSNGFIFETNPIKFEDYKAAFKDVALNIRDGNTYLLNLTFPNQLSCNLSLNDIFHNSKAKYKLKFFNDFVCFSPETFITINEGKIYSYPMKGTIDASIYDAEQIIMNDKKEIAEHATIVDLIRNDLSIVSDNVRVNRYRYIDKIITNNKELLQVSSEITGNISDVYLNKFGSLLLKLLPAGSISGAPKTKTIEIINKVEKGKRGFYTGVAGIADGEKVNSCVLIRFIENKDGAFFYHSGGGITMNSDAYSEYKELLDKIYIPV